MSRLERAIQAIRDSIAAVAYFESASFENDDDLIDDLHLDPLELESLALIIDEIFSIRIDPERLFASPIYRTAASLAEYCIRHSEQASWAESRIGAQPRRRAAGCA